MANEVIKIGEGGTAPRRENNPSRVARFPDKATAVASFTAMARTGALREGAQPTAKGAAEREDVHKEAERQSRLQLPGSKDRGAAYSKAAKAVQKSQDSAW